MMKSKTRDHLVAPLAINQGSTVEEFAGGGFRWGPDGGEVIFPGTPKPQVLLMGHWPGREALINEMGDAFYRLYRTYRNNTRANQNRLGRLFLKWLADWDRALTVKSACDISPQMLHAYLESLRNTANITMRYRRKRWGLLRAIIRQMESNRGKNGIPDLRLAKNPFPRAAGTENPVQPLTLNEVQALLTVCEQQMQAAWNVYTAAGSAYKGPTVGDLYPFLYVACLLTTMNAETLRNLKIADISEREDGRLIIRGNKFRAGRCQQISLPASTDSVLDGKVIFTRVIRMTESLRPQSNDAMAEYLWLARRKFNSATHTSAESSPLSALTTTVALHYSKKLGRLSGITYLRLNRMRATGAELIRVLDIGVPVTAILGNTTAVAERHYKSAGARDREHTALARQMEVRTRYSRTKGARDVRDRHGAAQSGATPGFSCMNPFSPPPELKQLPGMCAAFLACPGCPQSGINVDSPETAADLLSMRAALEQARYRLSPIRWREVYCTTYEGIGAALERMSKHALNEAARLPLRILPELE